MRKYAMSVFEVMKQLKLLNWYTLLVGLERGWCKKENLIDHCEEIINQQFDADIDDGLITVIAEKNRSTEDLVTIVLQLLKNKKKPLTLEKKIEAVEKWRLAHLYWLIHQNWPEQKKLDALQELYAQFEFPDDMAACSIYSKDKIDPLVAAIRVMEKLSHKFCQQHS